MVSTASIFGPLDSKEWWASLVDIYTEEAAHAKDDAQAAAHLAEAGRILHEELGRSKDAQALYEQAWDKDPSNLQAVRQLVQLARQGSHWATAIRWLRCLIENSPSARLAQPYRLTLVRILGGKLGDKRRALVECGYVLDEEPENEEALILFEQLGADAPETQIDFLKRRFDAERVPENQALLAIKIGQMLELSSPVEASRAYQAALEAEPDSQVAAAGLYRLLGQSEDPEAAYRFLLSSGQANSSPERSSFFELAKLAVMHESPTEAGNLIHLPDVDPMYALDTHSADGVLSIEDWEALGTLGAVELCRRGHIREANGDLTQARRFYEQARGVDERYFAPTHALRRIEGLLGDPSRYADTLSVLSTHGITPTFQAWLSTHLGLLLLHRSLQPREALKAFEDALSTQLSSMRSASAKGAAGLEPYVHLVAESTDAHRAVRTLKSLCDDLALDAVPWVLYDTIGHLYETRLNNEDEALRYYELSLSRFPRNLHAQEVRRRILRDKGEQTRLSEANENDAKFSEGIRKLDLLDAIAQSQLALGVNAGAEDAWRSSLELDMDWYPARLGLGQLLDRQGRWRELAELIEDELRSTSFEDAPRHALLGNLAELYEFRLDAPEKAERVYQQLLAVKPGAPDAIAGLERLYDRLGQWEALAGVLQRHLDTLEAPSSKAEYLMKLGDLYHHRLGDLDAAIRLYESACAVAPSSAEAEWGLELLLLAARQRPRLREMYRGQLGLLGDGFGARVLKHKLADVAQPSQSIELWQQLAEDDPSDLVAQWGLLRSAAERGDNPGMSQVLLNIVDSLGARHDIIRMLREAGERASRGSSRDMQIDIWERLAALAPDEPAAWGALQSLYMGGGTASERLEFLTRFEASGVDAASRSAALWQAELFGETAGLGAVKRGARFRRAAELVKDDLTPIWLLVDRGLEMSTRERIQWLEVLGSHAQNRRAASQYLNLAGQLAAHEEGDTLLGLRLFQASLRKSPSNIDAAEQVERILGDLGQEYALATFYRDRLAEASDVHDRVSTLKRLARVLHHKLDDLSSAANALNEVLTMRPNDTDAHWGLAEIHTASGNFAESASHYDAFINSATEDNEISKGYRRLGELHLRHLGRAQKAVEAFQLAQSIEESSEGLLGLADALVAAGDLDLAHLTYRRLERRSGDKDDRLLSILGQCAALLYGERQAEALRRLNALDWPTPLPPRARAKVAALLSYDRPLKDTLRKRLVHLLEGEPQREHSETERVDSVPAVAPEDVSASSVERSMSSSATEASSWDQTLSPLELQSNDGRREVLNEGGGGSFRPKDDGLSRLMNQSYWKNLVVEYRTEPAAQDWINGVIEWLDGRASYTSVRSVPANVSQSDILSLIPDQLSPSLYRVLSATVPALECPITDEVGRAEIAAEGRPFESTSEVAQCARQLATAFGLREVIVVRNDIRPYTVDVFRKSTPVVTLGARLVDEFSLGHLSFLIASCLAPIAFGGLPLRFTPAGRAIDDSVLASTLGGIFRTLGLDVELRDREQGHAHRIQARLETALKEGDLARLRPYSRDAYMAVGTIGIPALRQSLEACTARLAHVVSYSFGGSMEALRRLNFDDRPRSGLLNADLLAVLRDDIVLGDLLAFASSETCLNMRGRIYGERGEGAS